MSTSLLDSLTDTRSSDSLSAMLLSAANQCCHARLVRIYPAEGVGHVFEVGDGRQFVGRELGCDIRLEDDTVSRQHATIERFEDDYAVTDLGSTNGTYVNEERIESRWLNAGDRVRFGNQILKFLSADQIEAQYHDAVYRIMTTDGLTLTYNKRYLLDVLDREIYRAVRTDHPLCVLMFDVDEFKSVNDVYGHLAGDEALAELCHRARTVLRQDEVLARYGGDEFALVMADTPLQHAREAAERLRQKISEAPLHTSFGDIPVTISVGITEMPHEKTITASQLIELADRRLYMAKESGRNRIIG